ncbi:SWEET sugar transporter [Artemisia annua]|uniref:SWEET sugar transporter n=1 Tax=Artemisia annua TaxID=35608 RepID=A0A2U1LNF6_ARTAN|nr:SWEET sugar transporter [Artemisia annua]
MLFILLGFGLIVLLTEFLAKGAHRVGIVGWICLIFSLCVFVAPLGVVLAGDFNIVIPNTLGFTFGILQIILYYV